MNAISLLVGAALRERYKSEGIMTLGELIASLEKCEPTLPVYFEDGKKPCNFDSWRGSYESLAISDNETPCKNAGELLERANNALTRVFYGYKGGEYDMCKSTQIHRANYGECGNSFISAVIVGENGVVIECEEDEK